MRRICGARSIRGFRGIKIKGGDGDLAHDERVVRAVRELIGPDVALMLDFNQSLDPTEATRRIARLAAYDLHWIEEPVAAENLEGHAKVRETSPISIQSGENWWFPRGFAEAIGAAASDFIMPDLVSPAGSASRAKPKPHQFRCPATCSPKPVLT
jgi:mandelate racemase